MADGRRQRGRGRLGPRGCPRTAGRGGIRPADGEGEKPGKSQVPARGAPGPSGCPTRQMSPALPAETRPGATVAGTLCGLADRFGNPTLGAVDAWSVSVASGSGASRIFIPGGVRARAADACLAVSVVARITFTLTLQSSWASFRRLISGPVRRCGSNGVVRPTTRRPSPQPAGWSLSAPGIGGYSRTTRRVGSNSGRAVCPQCPTDIRLPMRWMGNNMWRSGPVDHLVGRAGRVSCRRT